MKPILIKLHSTPSYSIREELVSNQTSKYYYHPQVELVYFEKGNGICIIGDKILNFKCGDIFLLAKELPHLFKNDESYLNKNIKVRTLVLRQRGCCDVRVFKWWYAGASICDAYYGVASKE